MRQRFAVAREIGVDPEKANAVNSATVAPPTPLFVDSEGRNADACATLGDPRQFPTLASAPESVRALYGLAERCLAAATGQERDSVELELQVALASLLSGSGAELAGVLAAASSVALARQCWRTLDRAWCAATRVAGQGVGVTVFALPTVIVAAGSDVDGEGTISGILGDTPKLAAILRDHGALAGNRNFVLANALVSAAAIDVARLPEILAWCRLPDATDTRTALPERALAPAPISWRAGHEAVHLRFLVGTAIAKPGVDLLANPGASKWGVPLTRELAAQLGGGKVSVLALPRAPARLLPAVAQGRSEQRDVSAQLFVSNAIRSLRRDTGEPSAVISAHRAPHAPGDGELRLSLSSPFDSRAAEGFRCPLYPLDRVGDVGSMLLDLLRDCRVTDVRIAAGVHADRESATGLPLFFKPDTIPSRDSPGSRTCVN